MPDLSHKRTNDRKEKTVWQRRNSLSLSLIVRLDGCFSKRLTHTSPVSSTIDDKWRRWRRKKKKKKKRRNKARRELIDKHHVRIVRSPSHCVISVGRRTRPATRPSAFVYLYLSPSISTDSFVRFVFEHHRANALSINGMSIDCGMKQCQSMKTSKQQLFRPTNANVFLRRRSFFRMNRNQQTDGHRRRRQSVTFSRSIFISWSEYNR